MELTQELPKQPGYYWYKNEFNGGWQIVEVWQNEQRFWMVGMPLVDEHYIENFVTNETVWRGPIPEPKDK
jgi:hypothetical protein